MEMIFFILVILLATISICEYFSGKVLDIAFTGVLITKQEAQVNYLKIVLAQLAVRILFLSLMFLTYGIIFKTGSGDFRRIRTYSIIIFILIIFPFAMIHKKFTSWVKKTTTAARNNK
jgi:hypothetical protein